MQRLLSLLILIGIVSSSNAQNVLTIDSCRNMALRNNKQLSIVKFKQDVAINIRKALRTKYLPKVDVLGGYEHVSKEVSLLKNSQKDMLSNLGTSVGSFIGGKASGVLTDLIQQGIITQQVAESLGGLLNDFTSPIVQTGNNIGQSIRDAFRTDTRNIWAGSVMVRQPIFMGGAITAANHMADINEKIVDDDIELKRQNTLFTIDHTYWTIVSLRQKQKLAESYLKLVRKLDDDIHKMIGEGVATVADGLKVDVKENEAEIQLTQVENGLSLAKMLLCQLCGIEMDDTIELADEGVDEISCTDDFEWQQKFVDTSLRPEVRMLEKTVSLSKEATNLIRAPYLPQVALTGGYLVANPNPFNGFAKEFTGAWNVGVIVRVPVWNWFEGKYKVRASKAMTNIAKMELADVQEKINLQVSQCQYKVKEANKRLAMTQKNIRSAEENLRCANLGFSEGVIETTDVIAAQTAWQLAQSQKIDAEIEMKLALIELKKALGTLEY